MSPSETFDWLPPDGIRLGRANLEDAMRATRALLQGTDPFEPNRAHAATMGLILARAIQNAEDEQ